MWEIKRKLNQGTILAALVVVAFDREPKPERVEIGDLSRMLAQLYDKKIIDLSDFTISPGGEYSEDVTRFIGNYSLSGYIKDFHPLIFAQEGLDICRSMVLEAYQDKEKADELNKITKFLAFGFY